MYILKIIYLHKNIYQKITNVFCIIVGKCGILHRHFSRRRNPKGKNARLNAHRNNVRWRRRRYISRNLFRSQTNCYVIHRPNGAGFGFATNQTTLEVRHSRVVLKTRIQNGRIQQHAVDGKQVELQTLNTHHIGDRE